MHDQSAKRVVLSLIALFNQCDIPMAAWDILAQQAASEKLVITPQSPRSAQTDRKD